MFALLTHAFGLAAGRQSSYQKNLERVTQDLISILGKDKLLKMMTLEERVRGLTLEDILGLETQTTDLESMMFYSPSQIRNIQKGIANELSFFHCVTK
ncbi:hypothetical protein H8E77_03340 [bacterium]|nr:hypothetical protein [bacterium]